MGSLAFKPENQSGAGGPRIIHCPRLSNIRTTRQNDLRLRIEGKLWSEFSRLPSPSPEFLPFVLRKKKGGNRLIIEKTQEIKDTKVKTYKYSPFLFIIS